MGSIAFASAFATVIAFFVPFVVYLPSLANGFVYDDHLQVLNNPWIRDTSHLREIFTSTHWTFANASTNIFRPFFHLVLLVEYAFFETTPWGYHLFNVTLHAINSVLVLWVARSLLERDAAARSTGSDSLWPLAAAIGFGLHPVNVEAVAWISAIPELSYTFFGLATIVAFVNDRGWGARYWLALGLFSAGLFCKEPALMVLVIVCLHCAMKEGRAAWTRLVPFALVAIVFFAYRSFVVGGLIASSKTPLTAFEAAINVVPIFARYLVTLVLPTNLTPIHEFHPVRSLDDVRFVGASLIVFVYLGVIFRLRRHPVPTLCLLWIAIAVLPALYLPALAQVVFAERYLYFSSAGFAILCAWLLREAYARLESASSMSRSAPGSKWTAASRTLIACVVVLLVLFAVLDVRQQAVWRSNLTLWSDAAIKSPRDPDVQFNLGQAYHEGGDWRKAMRHYRASLDVAPHYPEPRYNLAAIKFERGYFKEARKEIGRLLAHNPDYLRAHRLLRAIGDAEARRSANE
jgi:tetratricopeptide (TPR) repeat protein